tara:strand:+ start:510 stop:1697 length:1188 start_codon:yes stop_codon:yes gene_type:complete
MKINHFLFLKSDYIPKINKKYHLKSINFSDNISLSHIAAYSRLNAGDTLLPVCVKDSLSINSRYQIKWNSMQISLPYTKRHVNSINKTSGLIIGGGGVFIQRANLEKKHPSGWHWNCSLELAKKINKPIIFFAVGYNQFRSNSEMPAIFKKHLTSFSNNIKFMGMRNHGSINQIKKYLPEELHEKIKFQPCPTTIIKKLYPKLFIGPIKKNTKKIIGINCAFDRPNLRFSNDMDEICRKIALSLKQLSNDFRIRCYIHSPSDMQILKFLDDLKISYEKYNLVNKTPEYIIKSYLDVSTMIGMRGHSQMIPFGCGIPIISLISHDKIKYFLTDIGHEEWGIEINSMNIETEIIDKVNKAIKHSNERKEEILKIQSDFFKTTEKNTKEILTYLKIQD